MIQVTEQVLQLLREWGKPSNINRSRKIQAINYYFVNGKESNIKARIKIGHVISNIKNIPTFGLAEYLKYLKDIRITMESANKKLLNIEKDRVDFYQILDYYNNGKHIFACRHMGPFESKNVHTTLSDCLEQDMNNPHTPHKTNVNDYNNLIYYGGDKKRPVQYLIIKNSMKLKVDKNTGITDTNTIIWHLIGIDDSKATTHYHLMQEFGVLPYSPDLGRTTEIT